MMRRIEGVGAAGMLAAVLAMAGCDGSRAPRDGSGQVRAGTVDSTATIYTVAQEDREMNDAIARAKATIGDFLPRLQHPAKGQTYIGAKVRFSEGGRGEHIWLSDVRLEGGRVVGLLVDDAEMFPEWKAGDEVRVAPSELTDWMTIEDGRVCGGFTTRVMAAHMSAEQRAEWLRGMEIERLPPADSICDRGEGA